MNNLAEKLEQIRLLYASPMDMFSSIIRSVIIPTDGYIFDVADYAAIEARVVSWIADDLPGLKAYRENQPVYEMLAAKIFGIDNVQYVTKDQRFVGKQASLGCIYGLGAVKFIEMCKGYGKVIPLPIAQTAIDTFRSSHPDIPQLWKNLEKAAIYAIKNPGKKVKTNKTIWWVEGSFLWCQLPSSRRIAYASPSVRFQMNRFGFKSDQIYHWGVHPKTKQWSEQATWGGTLTENVVQGTARDLMARAMLRLTKEGWRIVLTVHDELIGERLLESDLTNKMFCDLMAELPPWAEGCPVAVAGFETMRYRKGD